MKNRLTILVPTFNRIKTVRRIIRYLDLNTSTINSTGVEVLISDNHSSDGTSEILSDFVKRSKIVSLRVIKPPEHLPTGEENLSWASTNVKTEYIWPLADDDTPSRGALIRIIRYIRTGLYDLIILNAALSSELELEPYAYMDSFPIENALAFSCKNEVCSVFDLASNLGLINLFCNFSSIVFRAQELLRAFDFNGYCASTPIYSHVFHLLEAFKDSRCLFSCKCDIALDVDYTEGHWDRLALAYNKRSRFFWNVGIHQKIIVFKERNPGYSRLFDDCLASSVQLSGSISNPRGTGFLLCDLIAACMLDIADECRRSDFNVKHLLDSGLLHALVYFLGLLRVDSGSLYSDRIRSLIAASCSLMQGDSASFDLGRFLDDINHSWLYVDLSSCSEKAKARLLVDPSLVSVPCPLFFSKTSNSTERMELLALQAIVSKMKSPAEISELRVGTRLACFDSSRFNVLKSIELFRSMLLAPWPTSRSNL